MIDRITIMSSDSGCIYLSAIKVRYAIKVGQRKLSKGSNLHQLTRINHQYPRNLCLKAFNHSLAIVSNLRAGLL